MWEYKRTNVSFKNNETLEKELNKYGLDGWELIKFDEDTPDNHSRYRTAKVLFKRIIKPNVPEIV